MIIILSLDVFILAIIACVRGLELQQCDRIDERCVDHELCCVPIIEEGSKATTTTRKVNAIVGLIVAIVGLIVAIIDPHPYTPW